MLPKSLTKLSDALSPNTPALIVHHLVTRPARNTHTVWMYFLSIPVHHIPLCEHLLPRRPALGRLVNFSTGLHVVTLCMGRNILTVSWVTGDGQGFTQTPKKPTRNKGEW